MSRVHLFLIRFVVESFLEELVDKQKRDRLWDIYLGTTCDSKDRLTRVESSRIRRIEKQLATMKRNHRLTQDNLFPESSPAPSTEERPESRRMPSITSSILRRRSSFDQQTLEQWKQLATQTTTSEQLPSAIRRVMMRRSFRRSAQKSSPPVPRRSSTIIPTVRREQHVRALSSNCYPHLIRDRRWSRLLKRRSFFFQRFFSGAKKKERERKQLIEIEQTKMWEARQIQRKSTKMLRANGRSQRERKYIDE